LERSEEVVRDTEEEEGGHGHRPCEETGIRAQCPYVVVWLQKSTGSILAPNTLARSALEKGGGASERGPSKAQSSR
jgi:hypothetical protein